MKFIFRFDVISSHKDCKKDEKTIVMFATIHLWCFLRGA